MVVVGVVVSVLAVVLMVVVLVIVIIMAVVVGVVLLTKTDPRNEKSNWSTNLWWLAPLQGVQPMWMLTWWRGNLHGGTC